MLETADAEQHGARGQRGNAMGSGDRSDLTVLVIDDEEQQLTLIAKALEDQPIKVLTTNDPAEGFQFFVTCHPDITFVDLRMPKISGMELLEQMTARNPTADIILMTGHYTPESAVEAIRQGAADYMTKPIDIEALRRRVATAAENAKRRQKAVALDHELVETWQFAGIVGRSPAMLDVFAMIQRIAPHFRML